MLKTQPIKTSSTDVDRNKEVHGLARVCADIKNIALTNQHDLAGLTARVKALAEATHSGFKRADEQHLEFVKETRERFERVDERFDQLELIIRQRLPAN